MPTKTDALITDLRQLCENEDDSVGDLLREIMGWLKKDQDLANSFAKRAAMVLKDKKALNPTTQGNMRQVWDVLSNLAELLGVSHSVTKDAMQMTVFGEAKGGPPEMVQSLGRWLRGAQPAVSAYAKKINDSVGQVKLPKESIPAYTRLANLLRDLERLVGEIDPLVKKVTTIEV